MRQRQLQRVISLVSSTMIWPFDSGIYAGHLCNTLSSATTYEHLILVTCLSTEEPLYLVSQGRVLFKWRE